MIRMIHESEITLEEVSVRFIQSNKKVIEVVIQTKNVNILEPWYQKNKAQIKNTDTQTKTNLPPMGKR